MEFEVFIKDNAFIPDTVDIKTNQEIIFVNEDCVQHTIHCKGSINFPLISLNAGKSERYTFGMPGKYMISDSGYGDMKCVVEATEVERENIPKRNYFQTSKEKKLLEEEERMRKQVLTSAIADSESPIYHFSSSLLKNIEEDSVSARQLDEYRRSNTRNTHGGRKVRDRDEEASNSGSDSEDSEYGSMTQQRTKYKQSTSIFYAAGSSNSNHGESPRTAKNGATAKVSMQKLPATNVVSARRPVAATPILTAPSKDNTSVRQPSMHLAPRVVLIEDYCFQFEVVELVVGQAVEFRLSQHVPAHAEHELSGTSSVKALCFQSPLLQKDECAYFSFCPPVAGEINVVCKIYEDMQCQIIVTSHTKSQGFASQQPASGTAAVPAVIVPARSPATKKVAKTSIAEDILVNSRSPLHSPGLSPQHSPGHSPEVRSAAMDATRSLSPSSPAMQDVRTAVLQLDSRGDLSESQSSFYDSDDIFSDFEAPANLQATYDSLTPNRKKNLEDGAPKREVRASVDRPRPAEMSMSPGRTVAHVVSLEEFTFRPNHLVIRCGDCVRFRRSASQPAVSLVCEGEFSDGPVNTPCALSAVMAPGDPLAEERYCCFDHVFLREGSFEVQNEIYSFSKCNVIVVPVSNPPEASRSIASANTTRKASAAPKLMGSFGTSSVAQPVFHKPIELPAAAAGGDGKRSGPSPVTWLAPTTTTTVNASTTTVCTTSIASSTSGSSVLPALSTATPSTSRQVDANRLSPEAPINKTVPLYGSFLNLSHAAPANASADQFLSALDESMDLDAEGPSDNEEEGTEGVEDPATRKKREKRRRKREKLKLKQKTKKQAIADELLESELQPLLANADNFDDSHTEQKSPEAVISKYLSDSTKFRAYITAQADYGEEIDFNDDSDQEPVPPPKLPMEETRASPAPSEQVLSEPAVHSAVVDETALPLPVEEQQELSPIVEAAVSAGFETVLIAESVEAPQIPASVEPELPVLSTPQTDTATKRKRNRSRTKSVSKMDLSARFASVDDSPNQADACTADRPPSTVPEPVTEEPSTAFVEPPAVAMVDSELAPALEEAAATEVTAAAVDPAPEPNAFATPVKQRRRGSASKATPAPGTDAPDDLFRTPPSRMPPPVSSTAAKSASLLRAVLRISPQHKEEEADTPKSNLFSTPEQFSPSVETGTALPLDPVASQLSMLVAYEQQMEEFLLSRYEAIDLMIERGINDRLPSGKQVGILCLRDQPGDHFDSVGGRRRTSAASSAAKAQQPAAPAPAPVSTVASPKAPSKTPTKAQTGSKAPRTTPLKGDSSGTISSGAGKSPVSGSRKKKLDSAGSNGASTGASGVKRK